jgi:diguanylate cyclase (GGDEF)-like protein
MLVLHRGDPPAELQTISRIPARWKELLAISQGTSATPAELSALGRLVTFVSALQTVEAREAASAHGGAASVFRRSRLLLVLAAAIALVAAVAQWRVGLTFRRLVHQQSAEQDYRAAEGEYVDTLQVTESEDEAQDLLRRHLERSLPSARAVVLTRNNSADRLEPKTSLEALEGLRESLVGAKPRSCLAVRYARGHSEGGAEQPLVTCEVCGGLPGVSDCEPLLVGGEVIGAVLVNQPQTPDEQDRRRIREAVRQAAPVVGNLRNLAIAELRASTDALTGLPNQRAIQDTMKRMVAQASRTISPLAALLIDLDHFKQINDMLGHDAGDEVLAAVGDVLTNLLRGSDFVGRYGGEEFLMLLPSTDHQGAMQVAEATRMAIAGIRQPNSDQTVTASVGVAVLPDDAGDSVALFRAADRALYAAKRNGRNRVESASAAIGPREPDAVREASEAS